MLLHILNGTHLQNQPSRKKPCNWQNVHYVPSCYCHGLPIELKVLQSIDQEARKELTPLKLRKKATKFAKKTIDAQRKSFRRYKIWTQWDNPYLTLTPKYEATQIEVFGKMFL